LEAVLSDNEPEKIMEEVAAAFAVGDLAAVRSALAHGFDDRHSALFGENLLEKRTGKLEAELAFLADAMDLNSLVSRYVRTVPMAPYESGDELRFLRWIWHNEILTPVQKDFIRWQAARCRVDRAARPRPVEHRRFQELLSVSSELAGLVGHNANLRLVVNPALARTRLRTGELLPDDVPPPADIVLVCVGDDVRTVLLEKAACSALRRLAGSGSRDVRVRDWLRGRVGGRRVASGILRTLSSEGLIAFY